jgi:ribonucleoside-triphosphate reductase (formate)
LSEDELDFTTFIDNFIDIDNVADVSIDATSNSVHKDVVSLTSEMSKPHKKLLAFNKIYYEINKKYGF